MTLRPASTAGLCATALLALAAALRLFAFDRPVALAVLLALVASRWAGPAMRAWQTRGVPDAPIDEPAVRLALEKAGDPGAVASNDPVLSFYAGDPLLFGPPGVYDPLPPAVSCSELARILRQRGDRAAILAGDLEDRGAELEPGCGLRLAGRFTSARRERSITVVLLEEAAAPAG